MADALADSIREAFRELVLAHPQGVSRAELDEFGWLELLADGPRTAISVVFDEIGRSGAVVAGLNALAQWILGGTLSDGESVALVLPGRGSSASGTIGGFLLGPHEPVTHLVVLDQAGLRARLFPATSAVAQRVDGIDPAGQARLVSLTPTPDPIELPAGISVALIDGVRRAVAYEQAGLASRILEIARDHVCARVQFGRPIGANQSVQHRLADLYVAIEAASAALDTTWTDGIARMAFGAAYALAAEAADTAIRGSLQVCGGMGLTAEFALAPLIRRSLLLSGVCEPACDVAYEIVAVIGDSGEVPRLGNFGQEAAT
jgi:hypothetical protein